ncbi:MAG: hypothetical protein JXQ91_02920 [Vannielia sp.]|uniref:hypothetical protein n=1 Tax=Rhodobacterales TaxID=204455 RepID=UPI0020961B5D|nr:hypothetical protein [Oceanicola sp. 502str15]MCO6382120.1 hypothetical protein [Oceanicola sp. 502str15]
MKLMYAGLLSVALSAPAFAGGMNEPVMEPTVTADAGTSQEPLVSRDAIAADTAAAGSHDIIVPITALILFGIAVAQ